MINVGIVGLGRLGALYVEYLAYQIPKANVIAVSDSDEKRAAELAKSKGIKHSFKDYRDMLELPELDAVVVASPTSTHKQIVIDASEKGLKIFCEKPLSISLEDAFQMKEAIDQSGVFFHMGFMRRFDPGYAAAKDRILQDEIGEPIVFKASSRDPYRPSLEYADPKMSGGLFLDMGIHDFDLARWFMGDVEEVYSIGNVLAFPEMKTINDIDNAIVNMKFQSGTIGTTDLSRSGLYGYDIRTEIMGTKGTIHIGYLRETPIYILKKEGVIHDTVPFFMERFEKSYVIQLKDFIEKASSDMEPSITVDDGILALLVGHAATDSYKAGVPLCLDNKGFVYSEKAESTLNKSL
jgi:scyllo-inositol 2-dehydrogenase (NAD+)